MRPFDALRTLIAFSVLVLLHYSLRPLLGWRLSPDFLLVAVVVASVRVRPGTAAVIGLLVGVVSDAIGTDPFGAAALAFSVVAFGASWLQQVVFAEDLMVNFTLFFFGEWAFSLIFLLVTRTSASPIVAPLFVWAPIRAGITAIFGIIVLMILRPILKPVNA